MEYIVQFYIRAVVKVVHSPILYKGCGKRST